MTEYIKLNEEPIEIEYIEDEHDEKMDFEPSFWFYNRRYYIDNFIKLHGNPWMGYGNYYPQYIHAVEADAYYKPLFIELVGDVAVNVYKIKEA